MKNSLQAYVATDIQAMAKHYTLEKFHWLPPGWSQITIISSVNCSFSLPELPQDT